LKEFRFLQGDFPQGYTICYTESLFNTVKHRHLQSSQNWISFYILNDNKKEVEGVFHVHVSGSLAVSPYRAPFGSIEFSEHTPLHVVFDFINFINVSLKNQGIKDIRIKMPPDAYSEQAISLLKVLLVTNGFQVEAAEVGSVIHIGDDDFKSIIKNSERQVLCQYHNKKFQCTRVSLENFENVYTFIRTHQELKGYTLSMSFEELKRTVETFKDNFFLFVVFDQQQIIAASVSIKVMDHVLYNFYLAHDTAYKQYSPVIAIIEALYNFCKENAISILDLGTSMLQDKPNFSLLEFKYRIIMRILLRRRFSRY